MIKCFEKNLILIIIDTTIVISCVQFYSWWKYAGNVLCTHYFLINKYTQSVQHSRKYTREQKNDGTEC